MVRTKLCANDEEYVVGALKRMRDELGDSGIQGTITVSIYENGDITSTMHIEDGVVMVVQLSEDDNEKLIKYVYGDKPCTK